MHHIHTTPGFIIQARPYGEAGKMLSIFTREFGLVMAAAQGIRLERSKLRYHTQEYSFGVFSLVKGREIWRLTSAQELEAGSSQLTEKEQVRGGEELIARLAQILRRLLQGEEARPEVFDVIHTCSEFIGGHEDLSADQLATLESLAVARILHWLGYIGSDIELNDQIRSFEITNDLVDSLKEKRTVLNQHINKALKESMM